MESQNEAKFRFESLEIWQRAATGSDSPDDFANFLKFSRRSVYEVASMLSLLTKNGYLDEKDTRPLLEELEQQSKMIFAFRRTLKTRPTS